jgi:hypothetical protein
VSMVGLKKLRWEDYDICFPEEVEPPVDLSALIGSLANARNLENKGRGGIRIVNLAGKPVACRKYIHGGLFRGITGDIFFSGKRAIDEFQIMLYLQEKGFPIVSPCCVITKNYLLTKNPYILTYYEENSVDLLEFLSKASRKERYRVIKIFAELMWRMEGLGVYHPDLHLNNVLVQSGTRALLLLDFDRARRKSISEEDMERMFWRLNRYADKMEREGRGKMESKEKLLFLRAYGRFSGSDMTGRMAAKAVRKSLLSKLGWSFEGLFYRRQTNSKLKRPASGCPDSKLRK